MKTLTSKNRSFRHAVKFGGAAALLTAAAPSFAVGPDFSSLSGAVDFSTVGTAVLAIAALLAAALVVKKGAHMVLAMIGR